MNRWKSILWVSLATMALTAFATTFLPSSALAQGRAPFDTPALQPVRSTTDVNFDFINEQRLVTTVPAGKRLVIEHISYTATMPTGTQLVFAGLRSQEFGTFHEIIQINPPHVSASSSFVLHDASLNVRTYFEPGEEVWLAFSTSNGAAFRSIRVTVAGLFVNL